LYFLKEPCLRFTVLMDMAIDVEHEALQGATALGLRAFKLEATARKTEP
jgi:hypothetical protein